MIINCYKKQHGQLAVAAKYLNICNRSKENLIIVHNGQAMIVKVEDFKTLFRKGPHPLRDKFGGPDYYVYYINFVQPKVVQEKLFNI